MPDESIIEDFKRRLDFRFHNDRSVKKHRRQIYRLHQKIKSLWKEIAFENKLIRARHKILATDVADVVKRKLAKLRPDANQVYPRKVFRHSPPP